jgi:prepilin-type N-terminal cleavage/methylation domain-containing protein
MPHPRSNRTSRSSSLRQASLRQGMSLLEVVLALAILAMSAAILAQVSRTATDNGLLAHRLSTAQILAESKMAEVVTGAIALQGGTGWTPITDPVPNGIWYYQIEMMDAVRKDMVGVRLAVTDEPGMQENRELFFIVRWMIDPSLGLDTMPTTTPTGATGGTGATSGAAGGIQ